MTTQNNNPGLLDGKTIMITGASSGIGAAASHHFAQQGARLILMARRKNKLHTLTKEITRSGGHATAVVGDVRLPEDVDRAIHTAIQRYDQLDAAFNNAGHGTLGPRLHETEQTVYDHIMDINVRGTWNCLRAQITHMLTQHNGGSIVNTSSTAGLFATGAIAPYVAAKHAVLGLTKTAAAEYGHQNIRVNALIVGATRTPLLEKIINGPTHTTENDLTARSIQHRLADPKEIAHTAAWLCSDHTTFITGSAIPIDGGCTAI